MSENPSLLDDPTVPVADLADGRARIDALDDAIRGLVARRVEVSRQVQAIRREAGTHGIQHARENEVIGRYTDAFGEGGTDIALTVLTLCRGRITGGGSGI